MDLAIPRRGVLGDALEEGGLVLHHDSTPQGNITSDRLGNISNDKRRRSLLDVCIRLSEESDYIEVSKNVLSKHRQDGKSCGDLHGRDCVDSTCNLNGKGFMNRTEWISEPFYKMERMFNRVTRQA